VIALDARAAARLAARGVGYRRMEDFYSERALNDEAEDRMDALARWADRVDAVLGDAVPALAGLPVARLQYATLAWLAGALYFRGYALDHLAARIGPARVTWFTERDADGAWRDGDPFGEHAPSLWPLVIGRWASGRADARPLVRAPGRAARATTRRPRLRAALATVRQAVARRRCAAWSGGVLFLQDNYDLAAVRRRLDATGVATALARDLRLDSAPCPSPALTAELAAAWERVRATPELRAPFRAGALDLWPIAEPALRRFVTVIAPALHAHVTAARETLARTRPRAVLAPYAEGVWQTATMHAARTLGIPTVVHQHGGLVGACENPIWRATDRDVADHVLVYGDGVAAAVVAEDARRGAARARTVVVGSARLDALARGTRPRRRASALTVLYIPDMLRGRLRHVSCTDYPDVSYYEHQRAVVDLVGEFPAARLVFKHFNDAYDNPIVETVRAAPNATVVRYGTRTVPELMWDADLIVIDYVSTALLECLLTAKPMLVLADTAYFRLRPEAAALLARRCTVAGSSASLLRALRAVLEAGRADELPAPDRAFLRAYGTYLDDGRSAERAVEALATLAPPGPSETAGRMPPR